MKLKRYRVTDFRSVEDSGWIDVEDVTALIGVNESGKTNLLVPLWKLNPAREGELQPTSDYPKKRFAEIRAAPGDYRFIAAEFETGPRLREELAKLTGAEQSVFDLIYVDRYFDGEWGFDLPNYKPATELPAADLLGMVEATAKDIGGSTELKLEEGKKVATLAELERIKGIYPIDSSVAVDQLAQLVASLKALTVDHPKTSTIAPRTLRLAEEIEAQRKRLIKARPDEHAEFSGAVLKAMPKFVYYSNYGNLDSEIYLPHVVQNLKRQDLGAKEAAKARTLRVLFKFVTLQPEEVLELGRDFKDADRQPTAAEIAAISEKKRERAILLQSASATLTDKFQSWWKQGDYRFRFDADGDHFRIWVSDDRRPEEIELESRSTGLQWFLSFYLVFLVESSGEHKNAVLLLDEPGLSLHPLAQRDLSKFFDGLSNTNRIIYTTHSPFLVDADRLDRVRKVYVSDDGTTKASANLRQSGAADAHVGAAYAVYSALNLNVAESLLWGCQPVVVEGASDQHYLTMIKVMLISGGKIRPSRELVFPPSGGIKTLRISAGILTGRDDRLPIVLLDSDKGGRGMASALQSSLYVDAKQMVLLTDTYVSGIENSEIEDLIPTALFADAVDRVSRARPDRDFSTVVKGGAPLVPQVEAWAAAENIHLVEGWKVEVAKRVKQQVLQKGIQAIPDETIETWTRLFLDFEKLA